MILTDHREINKPSTSTALRDLGSLDTGPVQATLEKFPLTNFGKQSRSFSKKFFESYPWLEYSIEYDAVFCYSCRLFGSKATVPGHGEEVFTRLGLRNWKKIAEKLEKHATSTFHIGNAEKWKNYQIAKEKSMYTFFPQILIRK